MPAAAGCSSTVSRHRQRRRRGGGSAYRQCRALQRPILRNQATGGQGGNGDEGNGNGGDADGGAIELLAGTMTITSTSSALKCGTGSNFSNNQATGGASQDVGGYAYGGAINIAQNADGIYSETSGVHPQLALGVRSRSVFRRPTSRSTRPSAGRGRRLAAPPSAVAIYDGDTLSVTGGTFSCNSATGGTSSNDTGGSGSGGAIALGEISNPPNANIVDAIFASNSALSAATASRKPASPTAGPSPTATRRTSSRSPAASSATTRPPAATARRAIPTAATPTVVPSPTSARPKSLSPASSAIRLPAAREVAQPPAAMLGVAASPTFTPAR